jgi:hypothetical protein
MIGDQCFAYRGKHASNQEIRFVGHRVLPDNSGNSGPTSA